MEDRLQQLVVRPGRAADGGGSDHFLGYSISPARIRVAVKLEKEI
jgi:hypothetical protein